MRKSLYIIFFLIASFSLNIIVYYIFPGYRSFLHSIKEEPGYIQPGQIVLNTGYNVDIDNLWNNKTSNDEDVKIEKEIPKEIKIDNSEKQEIIEDSKIEYISIPEELKITKTETTFLNAFKEYSLKEIELHPRLFDITWEYPDDYFEYYSEYLTLYFFGNKPYDDIKDIFDVLSYEFPFTVNEVDNFWDKTFYINLDEDFVDNIVRVVILYKNRVFWIKVKKEVYDHVKWKLNSFMK